MKQQNEEKKKVPQVKDLAVPANKANNLKGGNEDALPTRQAKRKR